MRFVLSFVMLFVLFSCGNDAALVRADEHGFSKEMLEQGIQLKFSEKDYAKIAKERNKALESGYHIRRKKNYVPVVISSSGESLKAKARLKGVELDHLQGNTWSFKLKTKKVLGLGHRKLAIQKPHTKNYLLEYLFHELCKREGLIALNYLFVPATINDSISSTYAMASVVSSETLRENGREEGPILKLDQKVYWERAVAGETGLDSICSATTKIKLCNKKWDRKDSLKQMVTVSAKKKLSEYRKGKLKANAVFDYKMYAKYVALSELLGSSHNMRWFNLKMYYNSKTELFEPVAFDCYDGMDPRNEMIWYNEKKRYEYFLHPLLDDLVFQKEVEGNLKEFCTKNYVRSIFAQCHSEIAKYMELIRRDEPTYFLSRKQMFKRAAYITSVLEEIKDNESTVE